MASGRKSPAVENEYYRMEEGAVASSIASRDRAQSSSAKTETSWLDITVRTDIDIRQDKLSQIDV